MSRSEWKRQQLKKFPPPATIKVKDDTLNAENSRQSSTDLRERILEKNIESSRSKKNKEVYDEQETAKMMQKTPKKKLDKFIADKQYLTKKIRSWDELSNQLSQARSDQEGSIQVRKTAEKGMEASLSRPKRRSRGHPWDRKMDKVHTKDTSIEGEVRIEVEMERRGDGYISDTTKGGTSRKGSDNLQSRHFENARNNISSGNEHNPFDDHNFDGIGNHSRASAQFPDISLSVDKGNSNMMPKVNSSLAGIPQFHPRNESQSKYEEKAYENKYNDKNNTWVAVPPSSFFPDINDHCEPMGNCKSQGKSEKQDSDPKELTELLAIDMADERNEWSLPNVDKLTTRNEGGIVESRSITRSLACKTAGNKELKPKEKKPGFLRAFMEKKKKKATGPGYAASAAVGSYGGLSTSVESRGVKSASQIHSNGNSLSAKPPTKGHIHLLPPPHGVRATKNDSINSNERGRAGNRSASAPRPRSNSMDKFRSSSMAQKFNRVMQLYDTDEM